MGRGKRSVFASLFGFKSSNGGDGGRQDQEKEAAAGTGQQSYYYYGQNYQARGRTTKVRPSDDDDDNYYGRHWYAERDINRRATEFIDRVHRGMLAGSEQDDG